MLIRVMLMIGVMLKKVGGRLPAGVVEKMNYGPPGKAVLCQVHAHDDGDANEIVLRCETSTIRYLTFYTLCLIFDF